jgi:hypothetical protein
LHKGDWDGWEWFGAQFIQLFAYIISVHVN